MTLSKKEVREITGFTFAEIGADPKNWMSRAVAFKEAALLIAKSDDYSPPFPYYYNSGISLELALKALAITKSKEFETNHRIAELVSLVGLNVTKDQECTLELLSELIVWSGRYPIPKKEGQWNNYHDVVQEKHIVREREGNVGRTLANRSRFPTVQNFLTLWNIVEAEYQLTVKQKA
jgi:HEPN domain-containing protein